MTISPSALYPAIPLGTEDPVRRSLQTFTLLREEISQGRYERARESLRDAVDVLDPFDVRILRRMLEYLTGTTADRELPMVCATNLAPQSMKDRSHRQTEVIRLNALRKAPGVQFVNVPESDDDPLPEGWQRTQRKTRLASQINENLPPRPLLSDLLQAAYEHALEWDLPYLCFTNSDIVLTPLFYASITALIETGFEAVAVSRNNVRKPANAKDDLGLIFVEGADAFVFQTAVVPRVIEMFGDYLLGEPHWDTALRGVLGKHFRSFPLMHWPGVCLHAEHAQQWAYSRPGGQQNLQILRQKHAAEAGLALIYIQEWECRVHHQRLLPSFAQSLQWWQAAFAG